MASRIIGAGSPVGWLCAKGVPDRGEPRPILDRAIGCAAPIERFVLRVAFAETESDFRLHEFRAEIEGMGSIGLNAKLVEQRQCVLGHVMSVAVKDVNTVLGGFDPEIAVFHRLREFGNFRA